MGAGSVRDTTPKKCCEWIGKSKSSDQTLTAELVLPFVGELIVLPESFVLSVFEEHPVQFSIVPYEVRGPPGPQAFPHNSRAPPVSRV